MLEITIDFLVFLLCFASCTLDFIIIIFFSCTHVRMYHVFFRTLRKLLERVEYVNMTL
jgi:hypothetical protein